jgi:Calcineurin-like phosphoesterase
MATPESKPGMTRWYHPAALAWTAYRVLSATNVTGMFDRRELMAALDPFNEADFKEHHDLSGRKEVWLDYVADTGDGWWSTYAVARLLAAETLKVDGQPLRRGDVLVFGGDQVYPTPSDEAYDIRLNKPFETANGQAAPADSDQHRSGRLRGVPVYAIPGNHDWYDGLTSFTRWFCGRRPKRGERDPTQGHYVCGRLANQTRSYFALKLPGKWWLCAVDVQLNNWIDDEQMAYFGHLAANVMEEGSNILLCVPNPQWEFLGDKQPDRAFRSLTYLCSVITGRVRRDRTGSGRLHRLRAVLSGDAHHYARYIEQGPQAAWPIQYITCGLGGAFLHPTHWTKPEISFKWPWPAANVPQKVVDDAGKDANWRYVFQRQKVYPSEQTSRWLTLRNFWFGILNWEFAVATGLVWLFAGWLMWFVGQSIDVSLLGSDATERWQAITTILASTPWPLLCIVGTLAATTYFSAAKGLKRGLVGVIHGSVHVALWLGALMIIGGMVSSDWALLAWMAVVGAILPPLVFGCYLMVSLFVFKVHWNEAFSSLRIADYKGFLRLHVSSNGDAIIYPVGLDRVPNNEAAPLSPCLIEQPVRLAADPGGQP